MKNIPPESRIWLRMNFTSGVFSSKAFDGVYIIDDILGGPPLIRNKNIPRYNMI